MLSFEKRLQIHIWGGGVTLEVLDGSSLRERDHLIQVDVRQSGKVRLLSIVGSRDGG